MPGKIRDRIVSRLRLVICKILTKNAQTPFNNCVIRVCSYTFLPMKRAKLIYLALYLIFQSTVATLPGQCGQRAQSRAKKDQCQGQGRAGQGGQQAG